VTRLPKVTKKTKALKDEEKAADAPDVTRHIMVPKHEIIGKKEAEEVIKQFNTAPNLLPYVSMVDPVIRAIGAKPGDVIKISRKSETAGQAIYYRYVVEA
jgi:DNA-directed RNA polymerase subunit H